MNEIDIVKTFETLGIPKMQTVIYLDLIKHKESTATQISKRTKMHRANVYDNLTKLNERNLVYSSNKAGRQVFTALSPDLVVEEERDKLENLKTAVDHIKTTYVSSHTPKVYVVEGIKTTKSLIIGLLEKNSEIWIHGLGKDGAMVNILGDKLMRQFHSERAKKGIALRIIFSRQPMEELNSLVKNGSLEARRLPKAQQLKNPQVTQIVCGNSVYIILWAPSIHTIAIENEIVAKEYLESYKNMWKSAEDIK